MRIVLLTGKGGVGKTTMAAATALRCAERGTKTLLLSTDAAHSLADALGVPLDDEPRQVTEHLWSVQIDTQRQLEIVWSQVQRYLVELLSRGGVDPITAEELTVLPGIDEVLALLAMRDLAESGRWDVLIVDCAPTAETLRLLALPEALGWYLQKVFPVQRRLARGIRPLATMLGRGDALPPDDVFQALLQLSDDLASVRRLLADPETTSVRLVLTPESVVVAETRRTFTALALYGYCVDAVIANKVFPEGDDEFRRGWAAAQQTALVGIRESFAGVPLHLSVYRGAEPVGLVELADVARELYGGADDPDARDPAAAADATPLMTVRPHGSEYWLELHLPLATRSAVDAARVGDDLVVTVDGHRRVLALPSVLRRCDALGGDILDGRLRVRFAPDESVWRREVPAGNHEPEPVNPKVSD